MSKKVTIYLPENVAKELQEIADGLSVSLTSAARLMMISGMEKTQILAAVEAQTTTSALLINEVLARVIALVSAQKPTASLRESAEVRARQIVSSLLENGVTGAASDED